MSKVETLLEQSAKDYSADVVHKDPTYGDDDENDDSDDHPDDGADVGRPHSLHLDPIIFTHWKEKKSYVKLKKYVDNFYTLENIILIIFTM